MNIIQTIKKIIYKIKSKLGFVSKEQKNVDRVKEESDLIIDYLNEQKKESERAVLHEEITSSQEENINNSSRIECYVVYNPDPRSSFKKTVLGSSEEEIRSKADKLQKENRHKTPYKIRLYDKEKDKSEYDR